MLSFVLYITKVHCRLFCCPSSRVYKKLVMLGSPTSQKGPGKETPLVNHVARGEIEAIKRRPSEPTMISLCVPNRQINQKQQLTSPTDRQTQQGWRKQKFIDLAILLLFIIIITHPLYCLPCLLDVFWGEMVASHMTCACTSCLDSAVVLLNFSSLSMY